MQPTERRLSTKDRMHFPDQLIASRRAMIAMHNGVEKNLCIHLWGGIGDQICAAPTVSWAIKNFNKCQISLATNIPELFRHLPLKRIFDTNEEQPIWDKYLTFRTISPATGPDSLPWHFYSHGIVNCVDYCTMHGFRWELVVDDKPIVITGHLPDPHKIRLPEGPKVYVHPGKHWQSKTFPKDWWDSVLAHLLIEGITPIIIGNRTADPNKGTVDVDVNGCLDLRDKTTLAETVGLLQKADMLITNDSSPLHMAASGKAWIACMATCKHWDFISHWRRNDIGVAEWQWREKDFSKGNMYYMSPNLGTIESGVDFGLLDEKIMREWLPDPKEIMAWGRENVWK